MGVPFACRTPRAPNPARPPSGVRRAQAKRLEEHHRLWELTKTGYHVRLPGVTGRTAHRARCPPPTGATRTARLGAPRVLPKAAHLGSAPARQKQAQRAGSGGRRAPRNPLPRSPPGGGQARPTARRLPPPLPRGPPRHLSGAGAGAERGARRRRRRRRRWLSRRWRRLRSGGAPARPSSSSPPRRRSAAWTSTPSPASPSTCCARRPPAATISTSGVRVRTAYLFCSSRRITSLPVGKRHSMKYWKKSSNPSDLYLGFQMLMMMRLKNIMQIWKKRNQKRITNKWVSVSSNFQRSCKIGNPVAPGGVR